MPWEFQSDRPIFQQLVERITMDIISGKYRQGDKLEAVRELALTAGVNPNTMQRALSEVEATGLIYTKRGDGRYVSEDKGRMDAVITQYVSQNVDDLVGRLSGLGLTHEQILQAVAENLNQADHLEKGRTQ